MPHPYSAHAIDDADALRLSAEDFESLVAARPALARRWLSSVAARLMNAERRILQLAGRDLKTQIANLLLDEERDDSVALPQESLAALLGVRRPSLNKVLRDLERGGVIKLSYRCVDIADRPALVRAARRTFGRSNLCQRPDTWATPSPARRFLGAYRIEGGRP